MLQKLSLVAACSLVIGLNVGCGGANNPEPATPAKSSEDKPSGVDDAAPGQNTGAEQGPGAPTSVQPDAASPNSGSTAASPR